MVSLALSLSLSLALDIYIYICVYISVMEFRMYTALTKAWTGILLLNSPSLASAGLGYLAAAPWLGPLHPKPYTLNLYTLNPTP